MAKLQTPLKSGFNAGDSYTVKFIRVDKVAIDSELSTLFKLNEKVVDAICESILKDGFHKEEPVALWEGKNILVDGHQRYAAAKKAGLDEIPYIEKQFTSRDEAILYSFERQAVRRNLTGDEILYVAGLVSDKKSKNGEGRSAASWAELIGVHVSTIYQAKSILKNASEEDIQAIREGEASIKKIYNKSKPQQEVKFIENDSQGLPANVSFLRGAVILLVESKQIQAAEMLINHFLKKNEKHGFYNLLPEAISVQIAVSRQTTN